MRPNPRVFVSLLFALIVLAPSALRAQTLVWDPNSESDLAGYTVYYGSQAGNYTNQVNVGNQTIFAPAGFDWSRVWYFAVQAYATSGLKSALSAEVKWTPPSITKVTSVAADTSYPLLTGTATTWTATATNNLGSPLQYQFWFYRQTGWTLGQTYSSSNTFTWTPSKADVGEPYAIQVWARTVGSTAPYEAWLGTESFAVTAAPMELFADVDFPTPPANQVTWTAQLASAPVGQIEYRFLVMNQNAGTWTVFREYATSNQAQWTPASTGKYAVEAWARRVGSGAQFEWRVTSEFFDVARTDLTITGLFVNAAFPAGTGTPITWTARVQGGQSGPIQYQWWLHSPTVGWRIVQPYGPSATFSWTPTWTDAGDHALQVWVRSNGSTAAYEAYRASGFFTIQQAKLNLTTTSLFPAAPGSNVNWVAEVPDPSVTFEYQFWVYSANTASWSLGKGYGPDQLFTWTPTVTGDYAVQAWARQPGSAASYELYRGTPLLPVTQGPPTVKSLTSNVALPAAVGTTIMWTAGATGGTAGPLQYQFWRRDKGTWVLVQDYSTLNSYVWTPTAADIGDHDLQVFVRSAGSTAAFEASKATGVFAIQ
jgi:hypothetical protein